MLSGVKREGLQEGRGALPQKAVACLEEIKITVVQGNPFPFTPSDSDLDGSEEFLAALEAETLKFAKPVVLAHGDSHYFRVDKPLPRPDPDGNRRPRIVNFTRVEHF